MQGVSNNFHTDLFAPLLKEVEKTVGKPYDPHFDESASFRVLMK